MRTGHQTQPWRTQRDRWCPSLAVALLGFFTLSSAVRAEPLGTKYTIASEVLGQERSVRVFVPPSYHEWRHGRYPALYMVDGDYHFHYLSGLLEQMSSISEQIPEMVLVAIDDRGKTAYRHEMSPTLESEGGEESGRASRFMQFLETELIPTVEANVRVSDYRVLAGQSMGGLFTVATLLEKPSLFDAYIAISPSLWWQEQALVAEAARVFEANPDLSTRLHLTVADERGMGVLGFADLLDRSAPAGLQWHFERHLDENHGSVGIPALRTALRREFHGFSLSRDEFYALSGPNAVVDHFAARSKAWGSEFLMPPQLLSNIVHFYQRRDQGTDIETLVEGVARHFPASLPIVRMAWASNLLDREEWQHAYDLYQSVVTDEANAYSAWAGVAITSARLGRGEEAHAAMNRALDLAASRGARTWQISQLHADRRQILDILGE